MKPERIGLLCNQSSVDGTFRNTSTILGAAGVDLRTLFSPQHGLTGHTQANMVEIEYDREPKAQGVPLYSLYGKVRKPTPKMLEGLDAVCIDLQDVGARGYTFAWTMLLMMEACAEAGVTVHVLDRPNPIGGKAIEGPILQKELFSFVGMHDIPIRHGLTLGELAQMMREEKSLDVKLKVTLLKGWKRSSFFEATGLPWVPPSPNMPTLDTTLVYPGMELLEGTNLSEGRGTTRPFEFFGAPFIDPFRLCNYLNALKLKGVHFRVTSFQPVFDKWKGELCHGGQIHVTDRNTFQPVRTAVAIVHAVSQLWQKNFTFLPPPYEYETEKIPFDILAGNSTVREDLLAGKSIEEIAEPWEAGEKAFRQRRKPFLLYK